MKHFGDKHFVNTVHLNFEKQPSLKEIFKGDLDPKTILDEIDLKLKVKIKPNETLLFFDEIQLCPEALTSLKYFCENQPELHVIAAGSLLGVLLSEQSFPVGKVEFLTLHPFSFDEFLLAINETQFYDFLQTININKTYSDTIHTSLWKLWKIYLIVGGLPEVITTYKETKDSLHSSFEKTRAKQLELIETYLADFSKYSGFANSLHLERLFRAIPGQLAKNIDDSVKRFRFTGVVPGVSNYIRLSSAFDWLEKAGLIFKVPILENIASPLIAQKKENFFKCYLFDVGILNALSDISPSELYNFNFGTYKGYIAENYVLQELKAKDTNNIYSWQGNMAEIEFLTQDNLGDITPIEVKAGDTSKAKSLVSYIKRYNPKKAFIYGSVKPRSDSLTSSQNSIKTNCIRMPIYAIGK